jgi:hypothetical protein
MRKLQPTILFATLGLTLVAVCLAARQSVNVSLPLVVFLGLGAHVVVLFWEHREKLHKLLGPANSNKGSPSVRPHKA